jgi:subtilisin family serine protease
MLPIVAGLVTAAVLIATAIPALAQNPPAGGRQAITSAEQLPRRTVKLDKLPSQYLAAPKAEVQALADALEKNLRDDLARFDIQDQATQREYYGALLTLAQFKGDWKAVPELVEKLKSLQDKPGSRATTGTLANILAEQQTDKRDAAWVRAEVRKRYSAMNWRDVGDNVKQIKAQMELLNPELVRGAFEQQLDVMARNTNLDVPEGIVGAIVGARLQQELIVPLKADLVEAFQSVIDSRAAAAPKADLFAKRQFAIAPDAKASEVTVGIWDSGVDLKLFKAAPGQGIAFDKEGRPAKDLLRPLGEAEPRWPQLKQLVKGAMDLRAALDTEDSRKLTAMVAGLKADQAKTFQEDLSLVGLYTHGTHVAGIAVEGNPFARVFTATMLWSHEIAPLKPSEELSRRVAAAYREITKAFEAQGVRVVNMSWRYGAGAYEGALAYHNIGANGEERKKIARQLFAIERNALRNAIAFADKILFIAGSGNEDNSADFEEYIPAGFTLPNLITVGAVDKAGEETSFSTSGKTVTVHANGFEVESFLPGGDRVKFSGTSMASPQVANLAAKLFALKPSLTVSQVKEAILAGADSRGRIDPRRSAELAGIKL